MPHHDKLNGPFPTRLGMLLPGFCLSFLVLLSPAAPATAQEQAPVSTDIAADLASEVPASQVKSLNWLRTGGDPDTVIDEDGNTVMHYAAAHPNLDILQEAVRRGGHCNRRNAWGATPLHFAASKGVEYQAAAADAARILARCEAASDVHRACAEDGPAEDQCRADPDAQDRRGNAPLHTLYAGLESVRALAGRGEAATPTLRALLAVDADPNVKNHAGDAPLMLAIRYQGAMFTKPEHVSELLRHDADPDTRNNRGDTPLIETVSLDANAINAEDDPVRMIASLLKHGADPDRRAGVRTGNSDTPLIRAARHEDDSVYEIEALLAGGADPCLRDRGGRLAYDYAAAGSAGQRALYDAGGYPDPDTGLCVRDLRRAEEQEQQLSLDQDTRQRIRSCLKSAGFDPGAGDGQFAPGTRAAVRAWQQAQGREGIEAAGYFAEGEAAVLLEACRDAGAGQSVLENEADKTAITAEPKCRDIMDINAGMFPARAELARCYATRDCSTKKSYRKLSDIHYQLLDEWGDPGNNLRHLQLSEEFQQRLGLVLEMCWVEMSNISGCYAFRGPLDEDRGPGKRVKYIGDGIYGFQLPLTYEWSGQCKNGVVDGEGTMRETFRGKPSPHISPR